MPAYSNLNLYAPSNLGEPLEKGDLPPTIPVGIERAGLYINHGILAGDLLFVDIEPAVKIVNEIDARDEDQDLFIRDGDLTTLIEIFKEIRDKLEGAVDKDGRPYDNEEGRSLDASSLTEKDELGRLYFVSRHLHLMVLMEMLDEMIRLMEYAQKNHLSVELA
jgi:hypothetical protein